LFFVATEWIGDLSLRLAEQEGCVLLLGFEQAIGYMVGNTCPDKDGIRTAAVLGEERTNVFVVFFYFVTKRRWLVGWLRSRALLSLRSWSDCTTRTDTWRHATRTSSATTQRECLQSSKSSRLTVDIPRIWENIRSEPNVVVFAVEYVF
jgi:hypothetical protein